LSFDDKRKRNGWRRSVFKRKSLLVMKTGQLARSGETIPRMPTLWNRLIAPMKSHTYTRSRVIYCRRSSKVAEKTHSAEANPEALARLMKTRFTILQKPSRESWQDKTIRHASKSG
jgi:hypothetical protein